MSGLAQIGVIVLLVAVLGSRFINERGLQTLTAEEKTRVLDAFSAQRKYSLLPMIAVIGLAFAFPGRLPLWALMSALLVYIVGYSIVGIRKMHAIGLPNACIRYYRIGLATQIGGLLFYFAALQVG